MVKKKQIKNIVALGTAGLAGSVMGQTLGGIGGNVAAYGQQGIANAASFMPATGTAIGGGMVIGALRDGAKMINRRYKAKGLSKRQLAKKAELHRIAIN